MNPSHLSVRAASWSAAQCVRHFCRTRHILDPDIEAFCGYLEDAATAVSVVAWDFRSSELVISGLGDVLPGPLASVEGLSELLCSAREVTASGMYAAWVPSEVMGYLRETAERSGLDSNQVILATCTLHEPGQHGWGLQVTEEERKSWTLSNNLLNLDALPRVD